ncbi:MAG: T9SS type A sorting domain-containing protein [Bacteroidia bacterium]|nr:T9SS type A sorting domain-containing protein [Bacteroidia bacterium]
MMRGCAAILFVLFTLAAAKCKAAAFFVAPNGSAAGNGSANNPWSLAFALGQPLAVKPGDTIWLTTGTYNGNFTSELNGTSDKYIYVLQYPGHRATLQDNRQYASGATLQVNGSWTIYMGFEITNSNTDRSSSGTQSFRPMGLQVNAPNTKFINLIIHDVGHGFGFWKEAVNAEIYGCIIYHCGTANSPGIYSTHGHGIYSQNNSGIKTIENNIIFNQFGFGIHLYPNPGNIVGYKITGNALFHNGILTHDTVRYNNIIANNYAPFVLENIDIENNFTYDKNLHYNYSELIQADIYLGATNLNSKKLRLKNNHFMGQGRAGMAILNWDTVHFEQNNSYYLSNGSIGLALPLGTNPSAYYWNNNTYYLGADTLQFAYQYQLPNTFNKWKNTTGFDNNSNAIHDAPKGLQVFILPNKYEAGRAHCIVYNWNNTQEIVVNLSAAGLANGQGFKIANAQNYYGAIAYSGIYNSNQPEITVNMSSLTPTAPVGKTAASNTAPEFATVVILPETTALSPPISTDNLEINVFPNPSNSIINIEFDQIKPGNINFEITNTLGQTVISQTSTVTKGIVHHNINTSSLNSGFYYLKITTSQGIYFKTIAVHH